MEITTTVKGVQRPGTVPTTAVAVASALARSMSRLASWRVWVVSGAVFAVFAGVFFASSAPFAIPVVEAACGQPPPDVRFTSSATDVGSFLNACGPAGRDGYRNLQVADLFYPLAFGVFMASSLALALRRLSPGRPLVVGLAGIALIGSGFDYLENIFAWRALAAFPDQAATNSVLGLASAAKTITSWLAGALLLLAMVAVAIEETRRRTAKPGDSTP